MDAIFADRMATVPRSFIREILKVTEDPEVISFAGGLPNPEFFPVAAIAQAAFQVLSEDGKDALQYSTTEGYPPLREYVAERYLRTKGLKIAPEEILITNGSQQALDLLGKALLNKGDTVVFERPAYLGAIQAFSIFEPAFSSVPLRADGLDVDALGELLARKRAKLIYTVPNFQNPSGMSYSRENRLQIAGVLRGHGTFLVEDDPYGELRFMGDDLPSMREYLGDGAVLLGTFSKTVSPGFRLGWICARGELMEKLVIAKQAADLHSNYVAQRIVHRYLMDNDLDSHVAKIRDAYRAQRDLMVAAIERHCPPDIQCTKPDGGMFLWMTLPEGISSLELLELAVRDKVAFVPGQAFYVDGGGTNTLRLNFSNSDGDRIEEGVSRLGKAIRRLLATSNPTAEAVPAGLRA